MHGQQNIKKGPLCVLHHTSS